MVVLLAARKGEASLRAGLEQALEVHRSLLGLRVGGHGLLGPNGSLAGGLLHEREGYASPLSLWGYDAQALAGDPNPGQTLAQVLDRTTGAGAHLAAILRNQIASTKGSNGSNGGLRALTLVYVLDGSPERQEHVAAWEQAAADLLLSEEDGAESAWPLWRPYLQCEQLLSDELSDAVDSDITLIIVGYCIMSVYTSLFLGHRRDFVNGRGLLAASAVCSVGLATLAAFGICALAGVVYNETVNIALFVLMGVGVDDAFVIVRSLEDLSRRRSEEAEADAPQEAAIATRLGEALEECGPAILLSSATNTLAFGLGATTPLPALRSFCIYASAGMVTDFLLQTTLFVAFLALDERRRLAGHCCVAPACCLPAPAAPPTPSAVATAAIGRLRAWRQAAARGLTASQRVRCLVLLLFTVTSGLSTWAAFVVPVGLEATDLVPPGSHSSTFFVQRDALMLAKQQQVEVIVQHAPVASRPGDAIADLADAGVHARLRRLRAALGAADSVAAEGSLGPLWLDTFVERLRLNGERPAVEMESEQLRTQLAAFAASPEGLRLEGEAALQRDSGGAALLATRLRVLAEGYGARRMVELRATVAGAGLGDAAFVHSPADIYYEQDAIMLGYTLQNLLLVILSVLLAVLVVSASPTFVLVMAFCVLSCCTHMFGWMALLGTPLNALSLIPLLLAVGLCIDYCAHVVHAFWSETGPPHERAATALRLRGAAVANGGLSTALSQLLLAFSESLVFTTFFKMMCGVVVVGLLHALVLLPVCFTIFADPGCPVHKRLSPEEGQESSPAPDWSAEPPATTLGCPSQTETRSIQVKSAQAQS